MTGYVFINRLITRANRTVVICAILSWRRWRRLFLRLRKCLPPCTRCNTLPVLVILNRFAAIFFVFILPLFIIGNHRYQRSSLHVRLAHDFYRFKLPNKPLDHIEPKFFSRDFSSFEKHAYF